MTAISSPDLATAMRLMDAAKNQGFRFERVSPGPDGPLRAVREPSGSGTWSTSVGSGMAAMPPEPGSAVW